MFMVILRLKVRKDTTFSPIIERKSREFLLFIYNMPRGGVIDWHSINYKSIPHFETQDFASH